MAWLSIDEEAGTVRLEIPIQGPLPEAPYESQALLTLLGQAGQPPHQVIASFFPEEVEFNLRLPTLLQHFPQLGEPASLSLQASQAQAVVHWAWPLSEGPGLAPLPGAVEGAQAYLAAHPCLLDWHRYHAVAVTFIRSAGAGASAPA